MINLYKNELYTKNGKFYTKEFIDHFKHGRFEEYQKIDKYDIPKDTIINCCYNEIFDDISSLLLCNNIEEVDEYLYDNIESGKICTYYDENGEETENEEDAEETIYADIYQYYLIDDSTADFLMRMTDEIIFYSAKLDLYILGVTHFGTSWDYVEMEVKTLI